jgi:hypothetical protein
MLNFNKTNECLAIKREMDNTSVCVTARYCNKLVTPCSAGTRKAADLQHLCTAVVPRDKESVGGPAIQ